MEMTPELAVFLVAAGFSAAFLSGFVGVGGAVVLTPILLYVPPLIGLPTLDMATVTGIAIVQVTGGALSAGLAHLRDRHVDRGLFLAVAPTMAATSFAGAAAAVLVTGLFLEATFATLAGVAAIVLLVLRRRTAPETDGPASFDWRLAALIAGIIGFFAGMVGAGGAFILIPALLYVVRVPLRLTIGTTLWIVVVVSLAGLAGKAVTGQIDWPLAIALLAGALPAGPLGTALSRRTRPERLTTVLGAVILLVAVRMWIDVLSTFASGGG
jgi:uncharacterized membrane protein YfcA